MCKAHSKVTHIKQQKYFYHLKGRGYNKNSVLYPGRLRLWKYFCCFICVTLLWALHIVIKQQFFYIYIRYGHSYNGRRIGTRIRSIKWYHFQWPWVTLTQISRSRQYLTLNMSRTVGLQDKHIFRSTMYNQWDLTHALAIGLISNDLERPWVTWRNLLVHKQKYLPTPNKSRYDVSVVLPAVAIDRRHRNKTTPVI